ncbi:MAG: oxidoreductase [Verrucomicrobiales bacterium]|nr:oxidoreductase [Verrucomicrobiales bacterium]
MNRRTFLGTSAAAGLAYSSIASTAAEVAKGPVKRVALIGSGWYGKIDLFRLIQVAPVEVVALCDVDSTMLSGAADMVAKRQKSGKRPKTYADYRTLLKENKLDLVLVATQDHWHALPMIDAVKAGCDVYVQKPTSIDVVESQAMLAAARKYDRVVQVGTQRRSTPHLMEAKETIVDAGLLGNIAHAEVCCYYHMRNRSNPEDATAPDNLDYEMWTGPAPMRAYNSLCHPRGWRAFMEYSNGIVGDMCIHMLDTVRWMLGLGWPTSVVSQGGILVDKQAKANTTDTQTACFDFDDLQVVWQHRAWGHAPDPKYPWAAFLYGDKGTLKLSVNSFDFIPRNNRGQQAKPIHRDCKMELEEYPEDKSEKDLERHVAPAVRVHMLDFLNAVAKRSRPVADIEEGHISTVSCLLANLSQRLGGRSLRWDADTHRVIGDDEANKLLVRPYREPWIHPTPDNV